MSTIENLTNGCVDECKKKLCSSGRLSAMGITALATGTAVETVAGTLSAAGVTSTALGGVAGIGTTLTGMGCAATQAAITASSVIPVIGPAVGSGIASASSAAFVLASNPVTLGLGAVAIGGYFLYKKIKR